MHSIERQKLGLLISPDAPLADKFLYRALVLENAYKYAKFQLPSSINFRDKEGVPTFNARLLVPCRTPHADTFMCGSSIGLLG